MEQNLLIGDHLLVNKFVFGPALTGVERAVRNHTGLVPQHYLFITVAGRLSRLRISLATRSAPSLSR